MAWCPECAAEYREGVARCAKCGAALVEERPEIAQPRLRERLPPFVMRRADEVAAAFGYAVEAVRVLRRHPSLLLVPLALAVFNEAESVAGSYVMLRHTAFGRQWVKHLRPVRPPPSRGVRVKVRFQAGPPVPDVNLIGAAGVLAALAWGAEEGGVPQRASTAGALRMSLISIVFGLLVVAGVNAFVVGGYYGVARGAVATGRLEWGQFSSCAKRFFVRMWPLHALLGPLSWGLLGLLMVAGEATEIGIGTITIAIWEWVTVGLLFFLAVTPFVIVVDDTRLGTAIKRSVLAVARYLTIAAVLILGSLVVAELLCWPFDWVRSSAFDATSWSRTLVPPYWPAVGVNLLQRCVIALLAAFFPVAALVWYGEITQRTARADQEVGGEVLGSGQDASSLGSSG